MKVKVFVRLARTMRARDNWKVDASLTPNPRPLSIGQGVSEEMLHTVRFALVLDLPESMIRPAQWPTIEVVVPPETIAQIPDEVEVEAVPS